MHSVKHLGKVEWKKRISFFRAENLLLEHSRNPLATSITDTSSIEWRKENVLGVPRQKRENNDLALEYRDSKPVT